jgi:hypothetical protein
MRIQVRTVFSFAADDRRSGDRERSPAVEPGLGLLSLATFHRPSMPVKNRLRQVSQPRRTLSTRVKPARAVVAIPRAETLARSSRPGQRVFVLPWRFGLTDGGS